MEIPQSLAEQAESQVAKLANEDPMTKIHEAEILKAVGHEGSILVSTIA